MLGAKNLFQPYGCNVPIRCLQIPFSLPPRNKNFYSSRYSKKNLSARAEISLRTLFILKMLEKSYDLSKAIPLQAEACTSILA